LYVHVRCKCNPTPLSPWTTVPFHTTVGVGVNDVDKDGFALETYPNPVKDILNVKISGTMEGNATLMLTDISGKELYTAPVKGETAEVDMKSLPKGVYMLKYADGTHYNTIKVVKE